MSAIRTMGKLVFFRKSVLLPAAVLIGSLTGCNAIDGLGGCEGPEFDQAILEPVELNQQFVRIISVNIPGTDDDDAFRYRFDRNGSLPNGVRIDQDDQEPRQMILTGTPTELGSFPFVVSVRVSDGLTETDCDDLNASRTFTLDVVVENMGEGESFSSLKQ